MALEILDIEGLDMEMVQLGHILLGERQRQERWMERDILAILGFIKTF